MSRGAASLEALRTVGVLVVVFLVSFAIGERWGLWWGAECLALLAVVVYGWDALYRRRQRRLG